MARKKLFYTKNQITENLYTPGNEYQLSDGTVYIGLYHRYSTGEIYTEPTWNVKTSKPLSVFLTQSEQIKTYRKNASNIKTKFKSPQRHFPKISIDDIQRTYIDRYFLYKINDKQVIEIDKQQYGQINAKQIDTNIYVGIRAVWYVAGDANTVTNGNVTTPGVIQRNQSTINRINRQYPGFRDTVNNPLELYVDTTIIVPPTIN
jgi:hypothetical protein